jgi:predicted lipoprotein with Yx(FWY)xxD motif
MRISLRSRVLLLVGLVVLAVAGGALGGSSATTVKVAASPTLGTKILVDPGGFTLYRLTTEKQGSISCTGACRKAWPPLLLAGSAKPTAGAGLSAAKLGSIKRPDGGVEVTYYGYPLHLYSGDRKPGQTNGQGRQGVWYAVTPSGAVTKAAVKTTVSHQTTTTTSNTTTPVTTTPTTTTGGGTLGANGCPQGQNIPQGTYAGDGDEDNTNGGTPEDGDGCL